MDRLYTTQELIHISSLSLKLKKKLGSGSFSTVYRAKYRREVDQKVRKVAVKQLKPGNEPMLEAQNHNAAQHINVVKLYGYVDDDAYKGLVFELCEHGDLTEYLRTTDLTLQMSREQREQLALDIVKGLVFLHQQNIIHRDFKTDNILLKEVSTMDKQKRLMAKISDFGLSIQLPPGASEYNTERCAGSPRWAAPESFLKDTGKRDYSISTKVDVFALGWIFSLLARDDEYFPLPEILEPILVMAFIGNNGLATVYLPEEHSSATTHALIRRCWSLNPAERPEASEVLTHLNPSNPLFKVTQ